MGMSLKTIYKLGATVLGAWVREFGLLPKELRLPVQCSVLSGQLALFEISKYTTDTSSLEIAFLALTEPNCESRFVSVMIRCVGCILERVVGR